MCLAAILIAYLSAVSGQTSTPSLEALSASLAFARVAWGGLPVENISFRLEALNDCDLRPGHSSRTAQLNTSDTETTMTFDDGSPSVISHRATYVISVNTACNWRNLPLQNTIVHEYGHVLIGGTYHSTNPNSVMYYVVNSKQKIMPEDRALIQMKVP